MNSKSERSNTGYKGITYRERKNRIPKYEVHVRLEAKTNNNIKVWIGQYEKLDEALTAREEFIKSLF